MSLRELGDQGLELWIEWSKSCPKYRPGACAEKWATFRVGGGRTIKSLFYWAKKNGWQKPPKPEAATKPYKDQSGVHASDSWRDRPSFGVPDQCIRLQTTP